MCLIEVNRSQFDVKHAHHKKLHGSGSYIKGKRHCIHLGNIKMHVMVSHTFTTTIARRPLSPGTFHAVCIATQTTFRKEYGSRAVTLFCSTGQAVALTCFFPSWSTSRTDNLLDSSVCYRFFSHVCGDIPRHIAALSQSSSSSYAPCPHTLLSIRSTLTKVTEHMKKAQSDAEYILFTNRSTFTIMLMLNIRYHVLYKHTSRRNVSTNTMAILPEPIAFLTQEKFTDIVLLC